MLFVMSITITRYHSKREDVHIEYVDTSTTSGYCYRNVGMK